MRVRITQLLSLYPPRSHLSPVLGCPCNDLCIDTNINNGRLSVQPFQCQTCDIWVQLQGFFLSRNLHRVPPLHFGTNQN